MHLKWKREPALQMAESGNVEKPRSQIKKTWEETSQYSREEQKRKLIHDVESDNEEFRKEGSGRSCGSMLAG